MPLTNRMCYRFSDFSPHSLPTQTHKRIRTRTHTHTHTKRQQRRQKHTPQTQHIFSLSVKPNRMLQVAATNNSVISLNTASDSDKRTNKFAPQTKKNETDPNRAYQSKSVELFSKGKNSKWSVFYLKKKFCHQKKRELFKGEKKIFFFLLKIKKNYLYQSDKKKTHASPVFILKSNSTSDSSNHRKYPNTIKKK